MAPRLAELNPNVKIHTVTDALEACAPEFFDQFDVISLSGYGLSTISAVENIARSSSNAPAVFVTEPNNFDAWFAQNLHQHKFVRYRACLYETPCRMLTSVQGYERRRRCRRRSRQR